MFVGEEACRVTREPKIQTGVVTRVCVTSLHDTSPPSLRIRHNLRFSSQPTAHIPQAEMFYKANRVCYVISTSTGIHPKAYLDRMVANRVARAMLHKRPGKVLEEYQDEERCFHGVIKVDGEEEEFFVAQVEVTDEEEDEEWEGEEGYNPPEEDCEVGEGGEEEEEVEVKLEVKEGEGEGGERKKRKITG